jgi:hypothetical protein
MNIGQCVEIFPPRSVKNLRDFFNPDNGVGLEWRDCTRVPREIGHA